MLHPIIDREDRNNFIYLLMSINDIRKKPYSPKRTRPTILNAMFRYSFGSRITTTFISFLLLTNTRPNSAR